jgi:2-polyprenyl-3-methyl-5-hydroxy-6-metoxy-1,4-benzoquinol methylase|tara:strand:+ start:8126 stop:9007 length:882 start_codon:yes stop_codon:yes gene_type:complete
LTAHQQHTNCLICNSNNLEPIQGFEKVELCKCKSCGFVFCKNIPTKSEIVDYYSNNYELTKYFSPITVIRYNEILDEIEKYRKTGNLLDIGAGYGFFLEIAKKRGWNVYGTELTDKAINYCTEKGLSMFKGEIQNIDCGELEFDVIISIEVIEHVNNPIEYLKKCNEILRKGGNLYLTTPNFNSYLRYRLKENYNVIEYPNHLGYFTRKTLRKLFIENGFKPLKIQTTGFSLTRLRTSKGKSDQDYVSETSDDEMVRYRIERNKTLRIGKRMANGILNLFKIGDSLKGSFIKE